MTTRPFDVDPDIRRASTPPSSVYGDPVLHERLIERAFARSWQPLVDARPPAEGTAGAAPVTLLEGSLNEPLLLTRDAGGPLRCLSNVCTHRGMRICRELTTRTLTLYAILPLSSPERISQSGSVLTISRPYASPPASETGSRTRYCARPESTLAVVPIHWTALK